MDELVDFFFLTSNIIILLFTSYPDISFRPGDEWR